MESLYGKLTLEDKALFWKQLKKAMLWRGWDDGGKHRSLGVCNACEFIRFVEELGRKYGVEFESYT